MMFAFGDAPRPLTASAALVEEIVHVQMEEILQRASDVAARCNRPSVSLEDVLFVVRKNPIRVQRLARYLSVKDAATTLQQEANPAGGSPPPPPNPQESPIGRCREFFSKLDSCSSEGGVLEQALDGELYDEARMERLRRMERMSRELTGKRYNDFTKARQVNFLGHKMRFPQKFHDWLVRSRRLSDTTEGATGGSSCRVDRSAIEAFTFLAYEAVGQIVEMSLLARSEMERNRGGAFTTNAVNPRYPMFQLPGLHSAGMATAAAAAQPPSTPSSSAAAKEDEFESPLRKRLKSGNEAAASEQQPAAAKAASSAASPAAAPSETVRPPLRPEHVRE